MLYVQTDMRDFHFIRISEYLYRDDDNYNLIHYRVKNQSQAIEILENWIYISEILYYTNNQRTTTDLTQARIDEMITEYDKIKGFVGKMKKLLKLPQGVDEKCASLLMDTEIQDAYMRHKKEICKTSRTGEVYKIKIDDRNYVIKIATHNAFNRHICVEQLESELNNEASIYKRLSYL